MLKVRFFAKNSKLQIIKVINSVVYIMCFIGQFRKFIICKNDFQVLFIAFMCAKSVFSRHFLEWQEGQDKYGVAFRASQV